MVEINQQDTADAQIAVSTAEHNIMREEYARKNELAGIQNKELAQRFSTRGNKVLYQREQISSLNNALYYLVWTYSIVAVILIVLLFGGPKAKQFSLAFKICLIVLMFAYPYVISPIQNFLMSFFRFTYDVLYGNVYHYSDY
jgi:hypothetical protein